MQTKKIEDRFLERSSRIHLKRCLEDLCAKGLIEMDDETITLGLGIDVEIDEEWLASFGE